MFDRKQKALNEVKMRMIVRRSLAIQERAKIKPTIMRPNLIEMSKLRGGDAIDTGKPLDLLWA